MSTEDVSRRRGIVRVNPLKAARSGPCRLLHTSCLVQSGSCLLGFDITRLLCVDDQQTIMRASRFRPMSV